MTRSHAFVLTILFTAFLSVPASAHHSFTNFWHMDQTVEISGVVKAVTPPVRHRAAIAARLTHAVQPAVQPSHRGSHVLALVWRQL